MKGKGTRITRGVGGIVKNVLPTTTTTFFTSKQYSYNYVPRRTILQSQGQIQTSASLQQGSSDANIPVTPHMISYVYRTKSDMYNIYHTERSDVSVKQTKNKLTNQYRTKIPGVKIEEGSIRGFPPDFNLIEFLESGPAKKKPKHSDVIERKETSYAEERLTKEVKIIEQQMREAAYAEKDMLTISASELKSKLEQLDESEVSEEKLAETLKEMGLDIGITKEELKEEAQKILHSDNRMQALIQRFFNGIEYKEDMRFISNYSRLYNMVNMTTETVVGPTRLGFHQQRVNNPTEKPDAKHLFGSPVHLADGTLPQSRADSMTQYQMTNTGNIWGWLENPGNVALYWVKPGTVCVSQTVLVKEKGDTGYVELISDTDSKHVIATFNVENETAIAIGYTTVAVVPYAIAKEINDVYNQQMKDFSGSEEDKVKAGFDIATKVILAHSSNLEVKVYHRDAKINTADLRMIKEQEKSQSKQEQSQSKDEETKQKTSHAGAIGAGAVAVGVGVGVGVMFFAKSKSKQKTLTHDEMMFLVDKGYALSVVRNMDEAKKHWTNPTPRDAISLSNFYPKNAGGFTVDKQGHLQKISPEEDTKLNQKLHDGLREHVANAFKFSKEPVFMLIDDTHGAYDQKNYSLGKIGKRVIQPEQIQAVISKEEGKPWNEETAFQSIISQIKELKEENDHEKTQKPS